MEKNNSTCIYHFLQYIHVIKVNSLGNSSINIVIRLEYFQLKITITIIIGINETKLYLQLRFIYSVSSQGYQVESGVRAVSLAMDF